MHVSRLVDFLNLTALLTKPPDCLLLAGMMFRQRLFSHSQLEGIFLFHRNCTRQNRKQFCWWFGELFRTLDFTLLRIPPPENEICSGLWIWVCQEYPPPKWKLFRTLDLRFPRIPPKWKFFRSLDFTLPRIPCPPNENCLGVWIWACQEYPPPAASAKNENCSGLCI